METLEQIVDRYIASFNERDADTRRDLIDALYASDGRYTDPGHDVVGPEQIEAFVAATQEQFPGYVFSLGGTVDGHHQQARFQWHAAPPEATEPTFVGFDVIVTDDDRISNVYGFLDKVPA